MEVKRPYQYEKVRSNSEINIRAVYVPIDDASWKRPRILTLENLAGFLSIKVHDDLNVVAVDYVDQNSNPEKPPNTFKVSTRTHLAVDDDYIYVWVPSSKRWKRTILSSW